MGKTPEEKAAKAAKKAAKEEKVAKKESKASKVESEATDAEAKAAAKAAKKEKRKLEGSGDEKAEKKAKKAKVAEAAAPAAAAPVKRQSPRLAAKAVESLPPAMSLDAGAATATLTPDAYRKAHSIESTMGQRLPDPIQRFESAPFDDRLKGAFRTAGFSSPSPIQAQAWPVAMEGRDLIAIAKTGSGKTVGFLLPAYSQVPLAPRLAPDRVQARSPCRPPDQLCTPASLRA